MSSDDLFVTEEGVIAAAERLLADGVFDSPDEQKSFEQLLKSYQKLFRTARRLMRLGDHNERQLNAAAEVIAQRTKELESLSTSLSKYLSPQIYHSIFTGAQGVEMAPPTARSSPSSSPTWSISPRPPRSSNPQI